MPQEGFIAEGTETPLPTNAQRLRALLITGVLISAIWPLRSGMAAGGSTAHVWRLVAPLPSARSNVAAAVGLDGWVYIFGGIKDHPSESPTAILRDVEAYDPATTSWTRRAPLPTRLMGASAATGPDGTIYVFGGSNGVNAGSATQVLAYHPATNSWTTRSSMPFMGVGATSVNGRIYLFAGKPGSSLGRQVEAYDPRHNAWSIEAAMPTPRDDPAVAAGHGGWIYVIGGQTAQGWPVEAVEAYNPVANTWTRRAWLPAPREWLTAATGGDGLIYAIGGQGAGYHGGRTVVAYDPQTNRWTAAPSMLADRTFSTATTGLDGTVYVIAGSGLSHRLRTVEAYTP